MFSHRQALPMKKTVCILLALICIMSSLPVFAKAEEPAFSINSRGVYMLNLETGQAVYKKNETSPMAPASLTKIMTVALALEQGEDLDQKITVPPNLFEDVFLGSGASVDLQPGEQVSLRDLIYATMLPSACDAPNVIAWHFGGGSIENFVALMNQKAAEIGAKNTTFKNPHGLTAEGHMSTAEDMAIITEYALQVPGFKEFFQSKTYQMEETAYHQAKTIAHTVKMLFDYSPYYYENLTGAKSGYTQKAGCCLASTASKDGLSYLLIVLGANLDPLPPGQYASNYTYIDTKNLFDWAFDNFKIATIADANTVVTNKAIENGTQEQVNLLTKTGFTTLIAKDADLSQIEQDVRLEENVTLPVKKGEVLGDVSYMLDGKVLTTISLVADTDVELDKTSAFLSSVKAIPFGKIFLIAFLILLGAFILYFSIFIYANRRRAAQRARRRRRAN